MKYSALVLDLDGTLLNSEKEVANRNFKAILECHKRGLRIIYATARPPRAVEFLLPTELKELGSFVFYNGALIKCNKRGLDIHLPIDTGTLKELLSFCTEIQPDIEISLEVKDEWYCLKEIEQATIKRRKGQPVVKTMEGLMEYSPTQILITSCNEPSTLINRFDSKLNIVITDEGKLIQIMKKYVSKENAIELICEKYEIELDQVISFGDDHNDIGLLTKSGYSVAMGNASQPVKEVADEVTLNNDQSGVAIVLERLLLLG